jgi:DNA polymerase-3 subunit delta'
VSEALDLPWLAPVLQQALTLSHSHAVLLHGAPGDGLWPAARRIAAAWLCEAEVTQTRPCGHCEACRLLAHGRHPDLHELLPEELRREKGDAGEPGDAEGDAEGGGVKSKRKPSRQIRIGEVRAAIDWVVTTSSRGRAKVVLVHPAEAMNLQSASALLKTLEEPPQGAKLLLTAAEPALLLPTVRSRCQALRLAPPTAEAAARWLQAQGVDDPATLLAACSQHPLDVQRLLADGIDGARWAAVPRAIVGQGGQGAAAFAGWPPARVLDTLQKLCHDGMALAGGAAPRFFAAAGLPRPAGLSALADWSCELSRMARQIDHPWNEGLLMEALIERARAAWQGEALATLDA